MARFALTELRDETLQGWSGADYMQAVTCYGSFYLWGVFPPFAADVARSKTKLSGRRRAERRAAIPWAISDGLARACETLARELGAPDVARVRSELAPTLAPTWFAAVSELAPAGARPAARSSPRRSPTLAP